MWRRRRAVARVREYGGLGLPQIVQALDDAKGATFYGSLAFDAAVGRAVADLDAAALKCKVVAGGEYVVGVQKCDLNPACTEPESELQEELDDLEQQLNDEYNQLEDEWDDDDDGMETDSDL